MGTVRKDTLKGAKWAAVERFSVQGIQFLLGLLMARILCPEDYGMVGMLSLFFAISSTFVDSGFSNALIRKKDCTNQDYCTVFYTGLVIAVICYVVLFCIAPWVGRFFHVPLLCPILRVQALTLVLGALTSVQGVILTREINFKLLAKLAVISSAVSGVAGVAMAYWGMGVWALVFQSVLSSVISVCLYFYYCGWRPRLLFSVQSFRELFGYGSKLLASSLLNTIYCNLSPVIIGHFFSARDLGFYSRGTQIATYPVSNVNGVLQRVTFPILARIQDDTDYLIRVYRKYICMASMVIFFGSMLLAAIADPLIHFVLSDKWSESIVYLQLFAFAIMFDHICAINLNLLQVKGRSDLFLRLEIIKKIISTAILFASIPFGVIGICASKIIYTQIAVFINTYYTGKLFHLGYVAQVRDFSIYLFYAALACVPAYMFACLSWHPFYSLLFACIVSPLIYWLMLRKNSYMQEVILLIQNKLRKK